MKDELFSIVARVERELPGLSTHAEFEQYKAAISGPNGAFTAITKMIGTLSKEDRPAAGKLINEAKEIIEKLYAATLERLQNEKLQKAVGPSIDPTLPSPDLGRGRAHILTQVREEVCGILGRIGFVVADGPEVETEYFCFDALNTPKDHPARDLQDTYYLNPETKFGNISQKADERYLLRTHTSSVQIRTLFKQKPPIRIIAPGRCFRRDTADATHSANFHQIEALYVDRGVTVRDLKATLDHLFRALLGPDAETRFRPHYFSYTEPSFEVDFKSKHLGKVGSEWMEIMGCGMVDPAVFEEVGLDPNEWGGFAFGLGLERIAMTLTGTDDIRYFYQNDLRFLGQFA